MSPKSSDIIQPPKTGSELIVTDKSPTHIFNQDKIFSRMYKPLGLEHHTYHQILLPVVHLFALYYCYVEFKEKLPFSIVIFELAYGYIGGLGVTAGCHRYWAHKSFKAKLPLQILLMIMQTISFQLPIHWWSLHHRIHHKFTDTEADPYNSKRGFWFSHVGWQLVPMKPEFKEKLKTIDMSDLENDQVVRFQSRWYFYLVAVFNFIIPTLFVHNVWNIPMLYCIASACRRFVTSLHVTWSVNSIAHMWGYKPYDSNISATEGPLLCLLTGGESWHNYHHTFPWDYKASEFGWRYNISTVFIDFFAWIGWAYDLKSVSNNVLKNRKCRTGDGDHCNEFESSIQPIHQSDIPTSR